MPGGKKFSFAAALYDGQPADDCASPDQHAPDTWRRDFAEHAGAEALTGVFQSGRGGQNFVLQNAARAKLRLEVGRGETEAAWLRRLQAAGQCLHIRGRLPTSVQLHCSHSPDTAALLAAVPPALQGAGAGVSELAVVCSDAASDAEGHQTYTQLLQHLAAALPSLSSLSLQHCTCSLPPPAALASLTSLSVTVPGIHFTPPRLSHNGWDDDEYQDTDEDTDEDTDQDEAPVGPSQTNTFVSLLQGIPPHLHKLRALAITFTSPFPEDGMRLDWDEIFTPSIQPHPTAPPYNNNPLPLTTITTNCLDDQLLELLLQHAPALQHISVCDMDIDDDYSGDQWAVNEICFVPMGVEEPCVGWGDILNLPRNPTDIINITGPITATTCFMQTVAALGQRLSEWRFSEPTTFDYEDTHINTATLQHFKAMQSPSVTVQLSTYTRNTHEAQQWVEQLAQAVTAAAPLPVHMRIEIKTEADLTHELVEVYQQMGTEVLVGTLKACYLTLEPGEGVWEKWPWERLHLQLAYSEALLCLPCPSTCHVPPVVTCLCVVLGEDADTKRFTQWLQHVRWGLSTVFKIAWPGNIDQALACMSTLRSARYESTEAQDDAVLILGDWPMTQATLSALPGLPEWAGCLDLSTCTWPLASEQYKQVISLIPSTYTLLKLGSAPLAIAHAISDEATVSRQGLGVQSRALDEEARALDEESKRRCECESRAAEKALIDRLFSLPNHFLH